MALEKWSEDVYLVRLADDPQLTDDLTTLEQAVESRKGSAVLDFTGVKFINSSNLAKMLKLRKQILADGGRLVLCSLGDQVWGALLVTGLDKLFTLTDDVATGLAAVQMSSKA
jgi:anti-anti-sigma factor